MADDITDRARAALEGVTDGPWKVETTTSYGNDDTYYIRDIEHWRGYRNNVYFGTDRRLAEFVSASRSLMPELLAKVEHYQREAEVWRAKRDLANCDVIELRAEVERLHKECDHIEALGQALAEVERLRGALDRPAIDANHIDRQRAFSEATFGPGRRTEGVVDHIRRELLEVLAAPDDLVEWVDVIILAFDGAWRTGADSQAIIDAIQAKQTRNEQRNWPDWRTAEPGKAIEHVREPHESVLRGDQ